jgi:sulfur-carrier protein
MKVRIPTPLRSYTGEAANVDAAGTTLAELFDDLERQFPGIRFRVIDEQGELRQHMNVFIDDERCRDLSTRLDGIDEVVVMQALSGG